MNTPEAIRESANGKTWDKEKRQWVEQPTDAIAIDDPVFAEARERYNRSKGTVNASVDKTFPYYYRVLGVEV
jgi:hypothetical protein